MRIHVIGLGYTGQTLAAVLADVGYTVYGSDIDENVLRFLKEGKSHILEKNLSTLIRKHLNKSLFVSKPHELKTNQINAHIVCVHTPVDKVTKKPDLEAVKSAFIEIRDILKGGQLVILRSTVPVETTRNFVKPILEESGLKAGEDFYLVYAPERTMQGAALEELRTLPQIIGGVNEASVNEAIKIFRRVTPIINCVSSLEVAELIKLIDNSYRDLRFAYAQEIGNYCKEIGLNAFEMINAANLGYPRNNIPVPSPGIGGVCLNKDPYILLDCTRQVDQNLRLVQTAREINESIPKQIADELKSSLDLSGKKIFIVGFAFKGWPETNDLRESPTLELLKHINGNGARIVGYDPVVEDGKIRNLGVAYVSNIEDGLKDTDAVIFMTNHPSFKQLDINLFSKMKTKGIVFDGWNLFKKHDIESFGLYYKGVGVG